MKTCKYCQKIHLAFGLCSNHYSQWYKQGKPENWKPSGKKHPSRISNKQCMIKGCKKPHYSKGYCRNHHAVFSRKGSPYPTSHKCKVTLCNTMVRGEYCEFHKRRKEKGIPLTAPKHNGAKGKRNGRWNGGTSEYKDHYTLKKQRKKKLQLVNYKCELCGGKAYQTHHKNKNRSDHRIENLLALCSKCHGLKHRGEKRNSKWRQKYGFTQAELVKKLGLSLYRVGIMHFNNELKEYLTVNKKTLTN